MSVRVTLAASLFAMSAFAPVRAQTLPTPPRTPRVITIPPDAVIDLRGLSRLGEDVGRAIDLSGLENLRMLKIPPVDIPAIDLSALENLRSLDIHPMDLSGLQSLRSVRIPPIDIPSIDLSGLRNLRSDGYWGAYDRTPLRSTPPEAWQQKDPADSLYRAARRALSSDANRQAANLFRRIREAYPKSAYTPDAPYWEAFALQRMGSESDLRAARAALDWQLQKYPQAATHGDASALATRIEGRLARKGDSDAMEFIEKKSSDRPASRSSQRDCANENDDERVDALDALIQMDVERAMPVLKKVMARRDDCSANLRKKAVWLVATRKTPEATEILMNTIKNDPDHEVRDDAVFWLANVPSEQAADMLVQLAKTGNDTELRNRAIFALSRVNSPKASQALRDIVLDNNASDENRGEALQWLANSRKRGGEGQLPFLQDVFAKAGSSEFKERIMFAASQLRTDAARDWLVSVVQNNKESDEVRKQAVFLAGQAGATGPQLVAMYDKSNDLEVKKQLIWVISQRTGGAGIDKLLDIAKNEKDPELRKQAIFWVSRSKDPRVKQFLIDIIDRDR